MNNAAMVSGAVKFDRRVPGAVLLLVVLCWGAFGGALRCGFVYFDDDQYVFENPPVVRGLTAEGVRWAFTTGHASNWHPLTWLSHMADVEWFGLEPKAHHAVNVWIHALNAVLLWGVLRTLTGRFWLAWWVAAIWCVHPLRAESVVWVSERKDVLAMCFGLLTLGVYARGRGLAGGRRQALAAGCYALSLMSKPTWVTLPFVLLLLDHWPLARWKTGVGGPLWREKWPLFALAAASCAATYVVQARGGAVGPLDLLPLGTRLANAAVAYAEYVRLLFWPSGLSVLYPYPEAGHSAARIVFSAAVGLVVSAVAVAQGRRRPWLLTGWLWFAGALVPMIGLVQVGRQSWADRYTYLPHVGLILALVWSVAQAQERWGGRPRRGVRKNGKPGRTDLAATGLGLKSMPVALAGALVLGLAALARQQTAVWQTNESLFRRAISATENNTLAHGNLGTYYGQQGQWGPAEFHLQEVLRIRPQDGGARYALGNVCYRQGRRDDALEQYRLAAQDPKQWEAMNDLAWLLATVADGRAHAEEALQWAARALAAAPATKRAEIWDTLSVARANAGDFAGAIQAAETALDLETGAGMAAWRARVDQRMESYRQGKPWRP